MKKTRIYAAVLILTFIISLPVYLMQDSAATEKKFISKVIDGDTVVAEGDSIRLIGIDTDERGQPCYSEAKKRMEELALNKEAVLERESENKDQYGRLLRYIFIGNENINLKMVKEGLAVARFYPENIKYKDEIVAAEKEARAAVIGCKWKSEASP